MPLLKLKLHRLPKLKRKLIRMLNLPLKPSLLRKVNRRRKPNLLLKEKPSPHQRRNPALILALNQALKQRESSLKLTKPQQLRKEQRLHLLVKLPVAAVGVAVAAKVEAVRVARVVRVDKSPWDNITRWQ